MTNRDTAIARDLQVALAHEVVTKCNAKAGLCDTQAMATFVAVGGVIGAGGVLMALMSHEEPMTNLAGPDLNDLTLFALMFSWASEVKDDRCGKLETIMARLVPAWENLTGKAFEPDWLNPQLATIVREAMAKRNKE